MIPQGRIVVLKGKGQVIIPSRRTTLRLFKTTPASQQKMNITLGQIDVIPDVPKLYCDVGLLDSYMR